MKKTLLLITFLLISGMATLSAEIYVVYDNLISWVYQVYSIDE